DALEADDTATGPLRISWGGVVHSFSHLAFGGENLTGLAVLSTQAGGSVYSFGTVPCCLWLARSNAPGACLTGPSTGFEMGVLLPGGGAVDQSLNALAIRHDPSPYPFFIDTCTPIVTTPGSAQVGVSGGSTPTAIIFSFGPGVAGGVATSTPMPWPVLSHPDLYTTGMITSLVLGGTSITLSFPALPPINLVMQAVTIDPVALQPVFSTPGTLVLN
ncbi:MAG: hypothetical protein KDC98_12130, partial [Planctomycetes bacterium]|nr:hypothetical protein [Planctomycetota bacterium]